MKTIFNKTILVVTLLSIVLLGCKKKEEEPEPTPTPTTYNFTAKVDGVDYKSSNGKAQIMSGILLISATKDNDEFSFVFNLWYDSIQVKTYQYGSAMNNGQYAKAEYNITSAQADYEASSPVITDKFTVTKFDKSAKKISGTFNFTGIHDGNQKVITEGTFTDLTW